MFDRLPRRQFLVVSLLPLLGCSKRAPAEKREGTNWDALIADLEEQIPKLMEETRVPGLSIAIIKDARLAWRRGFGVKDAASKEPVDDDTMFEAGSMSKPVFAYAVMKLCEKGVMNLDTPLTQYTSERFLEGDPRLDLITARHVLSHTSGFQNWRSDQEPLKIHFTPGEKYSYSGEGYSYLQSVVARMTGQAIEPYLKTNLFAPFGMDSSGFVWNDRLAKRMARPHDATGHPMETNKATEAHVARYGAAGELRTTPTDYAKFMLEVIAPKPADAFRLSQNSIKEMLRPHVRVDDGYGGSWALGWRIGQTEKGNIITHGGDNAGFHSTSVASVERSSGFVIMTNGENGTEILQKLVLGDLMVRFL